MPKIYPFTAYRYNLKPQDLKKAICPPYDVIGEKQEGLLRKSSENAIHVELPQGSETQKYFSARDTWQKWKKQGHVVKDSVPALYVYEQVFKSRGKNVSRRGFFCELKVEKPGKGTVLRHELTLAGPKVDRLNLIRATHINTSPIFGLLADPKKSVRAMLRKTCRKKPLTQIKDGEGVVHKLWSCEDKTMIQGVQKAASLNPVLIADGHHRYETSWNYFQESRPRQGNNGPASRMLFFICPMEDPGLVVYPTHRVLKDKTMDEVFERVLILKDLFRIRQENKPRVPKKPDFIVSDGRRTFSVRLRDLKLAQKELGKRSKPFLSLVLIHLHNLLLPALKKEDFIYTHDASEALRWARQKKTAAILVPPIPVKELNAVVSSGELMPQKSTYFYPKIITGLLFRSLEP